MGRRARAPSADIGPRAWVEQADDLIGRDPAATGRRLLMLAERLGRLDAPLAVGDRLALCDRLAAIESHVRLFRSIEAAIAAGRPAIEAAERMLAAAGRPSPGRPSPGSHT